MLNENFIIFIMELFLIFFLIFNSFRGPDDVEKSLELLDKVLSEFEDPDSLPPVEPESPSQGHQSEDDGYMSMNGRRLVYFSLGSAILIA